MAIDSRNDLHAVVPTPAGLFYNRTTGSAGWASAKCVWGPPASLGYAFPSVAVDPSFAVHASYFDCDTRDIMYTMKKPSGTWLAPQAIFNEGDNNQGKSSICANKAGNVGLAYQDIPAERLRFIWKDGGSWGVTDEVDETKVSGANCCVAMDSKGSPHVSYMRTVFDDTLKFGITNVFHASLVPFRRS